MYCHAHCHTLSQCLTDSETKWLGLNSATHSPTWSLTLSHAVPTSQPHTARSLRCPPIFSHTPHPDSHSHCHSFSVLHSVSCRSPHAGCCGLVLPHTRSPPQAHTMCRFSHRLTLSLRSPHTSPSAITQWHTRSHSGRHPGPWDAVSYCRVHCHAVAGVQPQAPHTRWRGLARSRGSRHTLSHTVSRCSPGSSCVCVTPRSAPRPIGPGPGLDLAATTELTKARQQSCSAQGPLGDGVRRLT